MQRLKAAAVRNLHAEDKGSFIAKWKDDTVHTEHDGLLIHPNKLGQLYEACARLLCLLCQRDEACIRSGITVYAVQNEFVRLKLWGDDVAIATLDASLERFDRIRKRVTKILVGLGRLLLKGK